MNTAEGPSTTKPVRKRRVVRGKKTTEQTQSHVSKVMQENVNDGIREGKTVKSKVESKVKSKVKSKAKSKVKSKVKHKKAVKGQDAPDIRSDLVHCKDDIQVLESVEAPTAPQDKLVTATKPQEKELAPKEPDIPKQAALSNAESDDDGVFVEGVHWSKRGRPPPGAPLDIQLEGLDLDIKGHTLLEGAPLVLMRGRRYGLIGRNGVGKTTLLRCIARRRIVNFPPYLSTLHVEQEAQGSEQTPVEYMLAAAARGTSRGGDVEVDDDDHQPEEYEYQAAEILAGLQFTEKMQRGPTSVLSGGWRMRVALAAALLIEPDLLLLDEPTNHLDLPAVLWLERFLREYQKTIVVVSHDRAFLNAVTTDVICMRKLTLTYYAGDYDSYLKTKSDFIARMQRAQGALDRKRDHMRESVKRMEKAARGKGKGKRRGGDDKKLSQVAERRKKIDRIGLEKTMDGAKWNDQTHGGMRLGSVNASGLSSRAKGNKRTAVGFADTGDAGIRLVLPEAPELGVLDGTAVLRLADVSFGYPMSVETETGTPPKKKKILIRDASLNVSCQSRIAILGENGAGKSTLLKILLGQLEPDSGTAFRLGTVRVAHFSQFHVDQLELQATALDFLCAAFPQHKRKYIRGHLGGVGIRGNAALQRISTLSGGQKSRVSLALLTLAKPHLLVLDEPTNHLDMDTVTALADAIRTWNGGVVVVSHDGALVDACTELYELRRGKLRRFEGDYAVYRRQCAVRLGLD